MNRIYKQKFTKWHIMVIIMIGVIIFLQNFFIVMSHDDFGYGSLSYGAEHKGFPRFSFENNNFSFLDIVRYLKWHYLGWGGRILSYFVLITFLKFDLIFFKLTQSLIILASFFFLSRFNTKEENHISIGTLIISSSFYGLIPLAIMRDSAFWPSASVGYLWTTLFVIFLMFSQLKNQTQNTSNTILFSILFFIGGWSQEQTGMALICFMIINQINKKISLKNILYISSSIAGYSLLLFAPGNACRMVHASSGVFYKTPFFERTIMRFNQQITILFDHIFILYFILFLITLLIITRKNSRSHKGIYLINSMLPYIFFATIIAYSYLALNTETISLFTKVLFLFFILITTCYAAIIDSIQNKNTSSLAFILAILVTHFSLVLTLPTAIRTLLPSILLVIAFNVYAIRSNYLKINKAILLFLALSALINTAYITRGYYANYYTHKSNENLLRNFPRTTDTPKSPQIVLNRFDDRFIDCSPWKCDYQKWWIKRFYSIPPNVEIIYK